MDANMCIFNRSIVFFSENVLPCTPDVRETISQKFPLAQIAPWTGEGGGFIAPQPILTAPPIIGIENGFCPWIVSFDDLVILLLPNRIEVSQSSFAVNKEEEMAIMESLLGRIVPLLETLGVNNIKRYAYLPKTGVDETYTFHVDSYFKQIINLPKVDIPVLEEPGVHVNLPSTMNIASKDCNVNCICNIAKGQKRQDSKECGCVIFNNDINTFGDNGYTFALGDASNFIRQAVDLNFETLDRLL